MRLRGESVGVMSSFCLSLMKKLCRVQLQFLVLTLTRRGNTGSSVEREFPVRFRCLLSISSCIKQDFVFAITHFVVVL